MRRLLAAGLGFTAFHATVYAQPPGSAAPRSPVRISAARAADEPSVIVRAQAGGNLPLPPMGSPMPMPMPGGQPPMPMPMGAAPMQLGMPRPLGQGPSIREVNPQPGATLGPAVGMPAEMPHPTYVPSPYSMVPAPDLDAPLFGGSNSPRCGPGGCAPGVPTFGRLLAPYDGDPHRWWLSAEYLAWFTKSADFPALVTTSSPASAGILGNADTRVLLGNGTFGDTFHSGARFAVGRYFGCDQRWAIDGSVFFLDESSTTFRANSTEFPVLARPFTNLNQNIPFSELITSPGLSTGSATVTFNTELWGADLNIRRRLAGNACSRLDLIGGFKYVSLSEDLRIVESFTRTADSDMTIGVPEAVSGTVFDSFRTENHFYGGTVGLSGERRRGRWFTNLTGKVSMGTMEQQVIIDGGQTIALSNGTTATAVGGLLAVPGGNIGSFSRSRFAVVPEVGFNIGYQITPHCRFFVGYNFLYLSNVLRPGDQIDTDIDITRIPNFPVEGVTRLPIAKPTVPFRDRDFFAQGVNVGLQWRW
jgi:hypothetical protein